MAQAEQVLLADPSDGRHRHRTGSDLPGSTGLVRLPKLTARDLNVLRLLSEGRSTAGIAEDLAYSESTIKNIIHELVGQMGARNRAHAVAMAIRTGAI